MSATLLPCVLVALLSNPGAERVPVPAWVLEQLRVEQSRGTIEVYMEEVRCVSTLRDGGVRRFCRVTRRTPATWQTPSRARPPVTTEPPAAPMLRRTPVVPPAAPCPSPADEGSSEDPLDEPPEDLPATMPAEPRPPLSQEAPRRAPAQGRPLIVTPPNRPEVSAAGMTTAELAVLALLNQTRARAGLRQLTGDALATRAARAHSRDMCARGFFDHVNPDGAKPWDRLKAAGARFTASAENIAAGYTSAQEVHIGWMNSPGHRTNRMSSTYRRAGVGIYDCGGRLYYTELFMK